MSAPTESPAGTSVEATVRRHMRFGWWSLLVFLTLGVTLEAMHGFKLGFYLDVSNSTRRHMWTLAHAHGSLLSILNVVFALTARVWEAPSPVLVAWASRSLITATLLLPGGFFLGGLYIYGGDPGLGILLTPLGALLLFVAVLGAARLSQKLR